MPNYPSNKALKYLGIATEMLAAVALGAMGGNALDKYVALKFPLFTVMLTLLGLAAVFYHLLKTLQQDNNSDNQDTQNTENDKEA
ncbi:MAG: AtpZ/AtpI family protein [Bernardetiaceae bacterium]|nr:AtpZ/AtpI family protein [Bernardetiaceae bacterium]